MTVVIRAGLVLLFLDELVVGGWNAVAPQSFYDNFPTVDLTPPFSEHFARDFGGSTLGLALLLGIALVRPKPHFVVPAVLAFLLFAVPHFFFHLMHLQHATPGQAVFLTTANAVVALTAIAVLVATVVQTKSSTVRAA